MTSVANALLQLTGESSVAKIEEELEAVKEQYASMECEVSRLQQAQTAAFKLKVNSYSE